MAERAATKFGAMLAKRDFSQQVASLASDRMMTRELFSQFYGQFNPELITLDRLHAMRRDPMIRMGLHYRRGPMLRADWHIQCEDPQIAQGVDEICRDVWSNYMKVGLVCKEYGYQGAIKQWDLGKLHSTFEDKDGTIRPVWQRDDVQPTVLKPCIPLPPDFTRVRLRKKDGGFDGLTTALWTPTRDPERDKIVEAEFALWWANEYEETWNNYYGFPLTGYAYRYWWSGWFRHHMEDRHFEQDADPPLQVWYPPGSQMRDGVQVDNKILALELAEDLRGGAAIAMPSEVHVDEQGKLTPIPLWKAEFLTGGENLDAFRQSAEYTDMMKLRALMVSDEALIQGSSGTGSRATSGIRMDAFQANLQQEGEDAAYVWNRYIIPQIVEANWGADAPQAKMIMKGFQPEDMALWDELIKIAFNLDPNALPIKFEEILRQRKLPMYTQEEQEQRETEAEAIQADQERQQMAEQELIAQQPDGPAPNAQAGINASGRYFKPREVITIRSKLDLHAGSPQVEAKQPVWAYQEFERRSHNVASLSERLEEIAQERYESALEAASEFLASQDDLDLSSVRERVSSLLSRMMSFVSERVSRYRKPIQGELAGLYHASGAAELQRLGLDVDSWDIGRDDVQVWASQHAGELIKTMDKTLVEQHLRPFLASELGEYTEQGVSGEPIELAQRLADKFAGYPLWMAKRVARTEARTGYNQSALDIWERTGIEEVQAYDGQGGESGVTDLECLRRNGEHYSIEEARLEDAKEHPNGTLGFLPVVNEEAVLGVPDVGILASQPVYGRSAYAVTEDGWILTQAETGTLLAQAE